MTGVPEIPVFGFSGWSMAQIQVTRDAFRTGAMSYPHQAHLSMLEWPSFAHGLDTRTMSLINTPFEWEKPDELPQQLFDAWVDRWPQVFPDGEKASSSGLRIGLGVAPGHCKWTLDEDLLCWMPALLHVHDTANMSYFPVERRYRFSAMDGQHVMEEDADPWVLFTALAAQYPHMHGVDRSLLIPWWVHEATFRYLWNYARVYGNPFKQVNGPAEQRESFDFKALMERANNLSGDETFPGIVFPDGRKLGVELIEAKSTGGSIFRSILDTTDDMATLRLLGALDNTRGGPSGSEARSRTHEKQTSKYLGSDCKVTAQALSKISAKWCRFNRWPSKWAPRPKFHHEPPEDQRELAETRAKNADSLTKILDKADVLETRLKSSAPDTSIDWEKLCRDHGIPLRDRSRGEVETPTE